MSSFDPLDEARSFVEGLSQRMRENFSEPPKGGDSRINIYSEGFMDPSKNLPKDGLRTRQLLI